MPASEETTVSLMVVTPRSLRSRLSLRCPSVSLISNPPPSTWFSRLFPQTCYRNQTTSIRGHPYQQLPGLFHCNASGAYLYLVRDSSNGPSSSLFRVDRRSA